MDAKQPETQRQSSLLTIALLIIAGEAIFLLPFVLPRIFRPTVLAVFGMNNTVLGSCYSLYGTIAMAAYLFGGPIADRFAPRKLMSIALLATSAGGFYMATYPSHARMRILYAYWGFTTIFLFWAALLKATRQWGGSNKQGKAFGFLDGGRGLVAALMATFAVQLFSMAMGEMADAPVAIEQQRAAFRKVIHGTSTIVAGVGILVWFLLRTEPNSNTDQPESKKFSVADMVSALELPSVWLLMIIVLCGYVGYKVTDDLSLYAKDVMLLDDVQSARVGERLLYLRPIVGIAAGFLADWTRSVTWIVFGFATMLVGAILISSGIVESGSHAIFYLSLLTTCVGVYTIRSLYFATMQEGKIPLAVTGTAIGLISVVGYTPDIFMGPVMGTLLDRSPGELGHQNLFRLLAAFSIVGLIASSVFWWMTRSKDRVPSNHDAN